MNPVDVVGYVLLGGLLLVSLIAISTMQQKLDDPDDTSVVYLEQVPKVSKLAGHGLWLVRIYRQSGNIHSEAEVTGSASAALGRAMATFRRAKMDAVGIAENTESKLRFSRTYHDHRGSNEGRKVGRAEIIKLA